MIKLLNISGETTFTLPKGIFIESVIFRSLSNIEDTVSFRIGTQQGKADILGEAPVDPLKTNVVRLDTSVDFINDRILYLDAVHDWKNSSLDVFILTRDLNG
jgi:hypothetical protein